MSDFAIRLGEPADHPLVYSSTAHALRFSPLYVDLGQREYTEAINAILGRLLASWTLYVAVVDAVPDEIAGFVLCQPGKAVASLYVKKVYRRRGVARLLMEAASLRDFVAVFVAVFYRPQTFKLAQSKGYFPRLSPYYG